MNTIRLDSRTEVIIPEQQPTEESIRLDNIIYAWERQKRQNRRKYRPDIFKGLKGIVQPIMIII